jgi:YegS/Rv2252/BmrU family lipid kinase
VVLVNPRARGGARPPIKRVLDVFAEAGWEAELWAGSGPGWSLVAARRALELGATALFCAGGDGMLGDVLPAVLGTEVALGVVPLGTGNVWARELGLPLDPARAIAIQLEAPPRPVDVGLANGRPFLVIAGVGVDAQIVERVESGAKPLGQIAYPLAGVTLAGAVRGVPCEVTLDDEPPRRLDLLSSIVMNGRLYGGLVPLLPDARVDDGYLDVALFPGSGTVAAAAHTVRALAGLHLSDPNVIVCRVKRLRIDALDGEELPFETDGDLRGATPLEVAVQAGAVLALGLGAATPATPDA